MTIPIMPPMDDGEILGFDVETSDARTLQPLALIRLMNWLSPAFPTGGFAYSQGLETAFAEDVIETPEDLQAWLTGLIRFGAGWTDTVFCAGAWRAARAVDDVAEVSDMCLAMCASAERREETLAQGRAFLDAARSWDQAVIDALSTETPLPVAVGWVSGRLEAPLEGALAAYLNAFVSAQIQCAMRLGRLGQLGGVAVLQALEATIVQIAQDAARADYRSAGGCATISEIMAMRHETLYSRIFKS